MFEKILAALRSLFQADMTKTEIATALDQRAKGLAWRTSIVDLMKVLGLDSSLESRRHLALELGYTKPSFTGTPDENQWLHERVLAEVAKHGIKIP